ncbi:unnamed protein product [Diamesa hyperborea]
MEEKCEEVQNILESLVHSREKKNDRIAEINKYIQIPHEHKKIKKLKYKKQKKKLSRVDLQKLGLYSLPRKTLKYEDYLPLNALWNQYMEVQLGSDMESLTKRLDPTNSGYECLSSLIHKSDFHGAMIKVVRSKCSTMVGHKGIIILDTKGTFNIIRKDNELKIVPKIDSVFEVKWKNVRFGLFGMHLAIDPAQRSTKKVKLPKLMDF